MSKQKVKTTKVSFNFPVVRKERLDRIIEANNITLSDAINRALSWYIFMHDDYRETEEFAFLKNFSYEKALEDNGTEKKDEIAAEIISFALAIFKELQEKGLLETLIAKAEKKKISVPELISEIVKKGM